MIIPARRWCVCLAALWLMCPAVPELRAQRPRGPKTLTLTARTQSAPRSGWDSSLEIVAEIEPGYHINSNAPSTEFLIPTSVRFKLNPSVVFGPLEYPKGLLKKFSFSEDKLSVYEGRITIVCPVKAATGAAAGVTQIQGELSYQACTDNACLPPRTESFEVSVNLGKGQAKPSASHPGKYF